MITALVVLFVLKVFLSSGSDDSNSYRKRDDEDWMRWNYENR